jgi:hypothetical protein
VTATVVGLSGISRSAFSRQNPGASFRWPNGRFLNSRCPCLSPVTMDCCGYFCTFARGAAAFAPLHCLLSSGPPALVSSNYAPSQSSGLPTMPPLSSASHYTRYSILDTRAFTFAPLHAAPPHLHLCTVSLALSVPRPLGVAPCQRVTVPACPPRASACPRVPMPTCPLALSYAQRAYASLAAF